MDLVLPLAVLGFVGLCLATTGLWRPMSLGRSGIFLLVTSMFTALFYGAYRIADGDLALSAIAKMLGEANYAFLIVFLRWQRRPMPVTSQRQAAWAVLIVSLTHLTLNMVLTGPWQMAVMTVQVLVLIGWVTLESWWLWQAQPQGVRLMLVLMVSAHWLSELVGRSALAWAAWQDRQLMQGPGWTDAMVDWMWVTFFLGFMAQLAVAVVVAQALRDEKDRLQQMVLQVEGMLKEKESMVMTLLASNAASEAEPQMASLAHELRQPLGAIQLNAEYLASGQRLSREEESQVLQEILRENHRAVAIVQGLRSLFMDKAPQQNRLDLSDFLENWIAQQAPLLQQQFGVRLSIRSQARVQVLASAVQLGMVLQNLVNNAVEAMADRDGGAIDVILMAHDQLALVDVVDDGPGLPTDLHSKVFEMNFSTKTKGMGLGLWLSRRIAQMHRGDLNAIAHHAGARMRLSLPLEST
jgi:signal transduction histidine kinase